MRILFCLLLFLTTAFAGERPLNFILVLVDDMGATDCGCTGSTFYRTPHIDQLARDGMTFTRSLSACTVCSPTRAALLTGKYPARVHITDWIAGHGRPYARLLPPDWCKELPAAEVTLPEMLKTKTYATASIGKWHLGNAAPEAHGFDLNIGGTAKGQPAAWFPPYKNAALPDGPAGEFLTERLTVEAERFMTARKDQPFFLYFPHFAVHTPLGGKKEVIEKYKAAAKDGAPQRNAVYASMVEGVDDSVGRLRAKVKELGLADRTVFIFTSDNGGLINNPEKPITTNLGLRDGKGSAYEGGVRVPLLIQWPGLTAPGSRCAVPVISMDLCATIAAASGMTTPKDGVDLRPLLSGGSIAERPLFWHYPHYHPGGASPYTAVLSGGWRLIRFYEDNRTELYNIKDDPEERKDLSSAHPDKVRAMSALIDAWLKETGAQMPVPNPAFDSVKDRDPRQRWGS
ncbi:MAG TPA: sulfatase [Verrucomicrobiales bacterium]|jgi:arylsulfatase A-like enzyme|nr:sulfatase [Verrucomicrobiales bacterium]